MIVAVAQHFCLWENESLDSGKATAVMGKALSAKTRNCIMTKQSYFVLFVMCLSLYSCSQKNETLENKLVRLEAKLDSIAAQRLPSATEVFHLRSECANLGVKILNESIIGIALTQSQISHYNPKTNRCYIEVTVQSGDLTKPVEIMSRYLYDGQTGEILGYAVIKKGVRTGVVFKRSIYGFEGASSYIDEMMRDG